MGDDAGGPGPAHERVEAGDGGGGGRPLGGAEFAVDAVLRLEDGEPERARREKRHGRRASRSKRR